MHELAMKEEIPLLASQSFRAFLEQDGFAFSDALMIEVARQLHDDGGMPMIDASRLALNAGGVAELARSSDFSHDFWIAVVRHRNTWNPSTPRGSFPVTLFGEQEYWSSAHFSGRLSDINRDISDYVSRVQHDHPASDASRIVITNISTADRRLRQRAASLGIDLE